MTSEQFCYWLQGFVEISGGTSVLSNRQWRCIQNHLALVFEKVTPDTSTQKDNEESGIPTNQDIQEKLIERIVGFCEKEESPTKREIIPSIFTRPWPDAHNGPKLIC